MINIVFFIKRLLKNLSGVNTTLLPAKLPTKPTVWTLSTAIVSENDRETQVHFVTAYMKLLKLQLLKEGVTKNTKECILKNAWVQTALSPLTVKK